MAQKSTKYEPTPCEQRILEVLLNPENRDKTVKEKCRIAEVDRKTYYKAFKKPEFADLVKDESRQLVLAAVLPIIHTFIKKGKKGSYQHGKVILEMAGLYQEKTKTELHAPNGGIEVKINLIECERPGDAVAGGTD